MSPNSEHAAALDETVIQRATVPRSPDCTPGPLDSQPAEPAKDPLLGTQIDVYRIESLLGKGGMGRVYLARHRDLGRPCALKILMPQLAAQDEDYVHRFINEGRAAAALVHPNVITVHAVGEERLHYFLEMEFVAGRSLRQLIADEGRLPPTRAMSLAARIAEGLALAHREHIIHQDLKPDNVLITLQGVPKIADFGLAKRLRGGAKGDLPEGLCGTPNYMAPELFQGEPATPASDVYALGVTLFLMLAGRHPFSGETIPALASTVATEPIPNIRKLAPDISLEIAECVNLMLDKSPANRPRDGLHAAQLLSAILGQVEDTETLLRAAFDRDPRVTWTHEGERYRLRVSLPGGRGQTVFVEPSRHAVADRLLMIFSTCCPAVASYYEAALKLNSEMPHGSVGLREIDGVQQFVVLDTYPRATVDPEEIRSSVHEVATRADAIEKLLTGADRH